MLTKSQTTCPVENYLWQFAWTYYFRIYGIIHGKCMCEGTYICRHFLKKEVFKGLQNRKKECKIQIVGTLKWQLTNKWTAKM